MESSFEKAAAKNHCRSPQAIAIEEPQELMDDRLQVQLLCGEAGESLLEVKSHLMAKHADGACARAVAFLNTLCEDAVEQVQILFHTVCLILICKLTEKKRFLHRKNEKVEFFYVSLHS